jgi:hypothetical protein
MFRKLIILVIYNSHEHWDLNKHFHWARAVVLTEDHDAKTGWVRNTKILHGGRKIFLSIRVNTESDDDLSSNMFQTFT